MTVFWFKLNKKWSPWVTRVPCVAIHNFYCTTYNNVIDIFYRKMSPTSRRNNSVFLNGSGDTLQCDVCDSLWDSLLLTHQHTDKTKYSPGAYTFSTNTCYCSFPLNLALISLIWAPGNRWACIVDDPQPLGLCTPEWRLRKTYIMWKGLYCIWKNAI